VGPYGLEARTPPHPTLPEDGEGEDEAEGHHFMPLATTSTSVPVVVDDAKCIADKGCTVCVDVCPLDVLRISDATGKAYMAYDECWYCMPCEADCPTGAVTVTIPYLLK
jgi:NAD-dependent dihydropyrimidine dehydrogenase PreA subunit